MPSKKVLYNHIKRLESKIEDIEDGLKESFKNVGRDIDKLNEQLEKPFAEKKREPRGPFTNPLFDLFYNDPVTIRGKVDAIIKHLGLNISVNRGEDSVRVTAPAVKKATPRKKAKK